MHLCIDRFLVLIEHSCKRHQLLITQVDPKEPAGLHGQEVVSENDCFIFWIYDLYISSVVSEQSYLWFAFLLFDECCWISTCLNLLFFGNRCLLYSRSMTYTERKKQSIMAGWTEEYVAFIAFKYTNLTCLNLNYPSFSSHSYWYLKKYFAIVL